MESNNQLFLRLLILATTLLFAISCSIFEQEPPEETFNFSYQLDRKIVVDTTRHQLAQDSTRILLDANTRVGNDIVFRFEHNMEPPENVADGGFSEVLLIQVPTKAKQFTFSGNDLQNADMYYQRSCFCRRIGALKTDSGSISGEKINPTMWKIKASLLIKSEFDKQKLAFDDVFIRQQN